MGRKITIDEEIGISPDEAEYMKQRPWTIEEIERQGYDFQQLQDVWGGVPENEDSSEDENEDSSEDEDPGIDLGKLNKAELQEVADSYGLDTSGTKNELIERIMAAAAQDGE